VHADLGYLWLLHLLLQLMLLLPAAHAKLWKQHPTKMHAEKP
jgi:hypothetical protein